MKFHDNVLQGIYSALDEIFKQDRPADRVVESVLKSNPRWGSRDRRFIAETTYDIVRWFRLLRTPSSGEEVIPKELFHTYCIWKEWETDDKITEILRHASALRANRESIPDWMDQTASQELGELSWEKEIHALNQQAQVVLRCNTLKINPGELLQRLKAENIPAATLPANSGFHHSVPDAILLEKRMNVFNSRSFREGLFEVQDASSQLVAPFLQVEPGQKIIDACAGAGGKTLHMAALSQNKSEIIALDTSERKLNELKRRASRADAHRIHIQRIGPGNNLQRLTGTADRVLLDVPCTGLGVLRRNPDAKWKLSPGFLSEVKELQSRILAEYSSMVKRGGKLVYSTCSILPSENSGQVKIFLEKNSPSFELEEELSVLPSEGFDGFYMARMKKC